MNDRMKTNMRKYKADYRALKNMPDGHPSDWLKKPWDSHAYVDMFVESSRAAPYLMGHIYAILAPIVVILGIFLIIS